MASAYSASEPTSSAFRWISLPGSRQLGFDLSLPEGEGVGDIFQEDETEDGVLVNSGVEIRTEPIGGGPELLVEVAQELLGESGIA